MRHNQLRRRFDGDDSTLSTRILSSWPGIVEVIGQTGVYDYVEFAAEYAPYDLYDLEHLSRAAELADLATMIKVDEANRTYVAQRALAAGIGNVLFADVDSGSDAERAVRAVRSQPEGRNGYRKDRRSGYVGGYANPEEVAAINDDVVVGVMIETPSALENLDEILGVEGVDLVQFGAVDYALSSESADGRDGDEVTAAERELISKALDAGVRPRVEIESPADVECYADLGVKDFNLASDVNVLHDWLKAHGETVRDAPAFR